MPDWYHPDWNYRKKLTVNSAQVDQNLTGFPVLVFHTDSDLQEKARSDGNDILFTAADGVTKIPHEIERYTSGTGEIIAHVKVPEVLYYQDTDFYMYYGNSDAADQQEVEDVWDDNYIMVLHMDETSGSWQYDSTQYNNHAEVREAYAVDKNVEAKVGSGDRFDDSDAGYLRVYDSPSIRSMNTFTAELWLNHSTLMVDHGFIRTPGEWAEGFVLDRHSNNLRLACFGVGTVSNSWWPSTGVWYHVAGRYNKSRLSTYVNAGEYGWLSSTADMVTNTRGFVIAAAFTYGGIVFRGRMDEIRVSNKARSVAWIKASYRSQNNPGAFYDVGAEEFRGVEVTEVVTSHTSGITSEAAKSEVKGQRAVNSFIEPATSEPKTQREGLERVSSHTGALTSSAAVPFIVERVVTSHVASLDGHAQRSERFCYEEDRKDEFETGVLDNVKAVNILIE